MTVTVCSVPVALFNVEGTVYAIDDTCQHEGVSLGAGELRGNIVRCRAHGWWYDVTTGHTLHAPAERVTRDPVQVVDGTMKRSLSHGRIDPGDGQWEPPLGSGLAARRRPENMAPGQHLAEGLGPRLEPLPAIILPRPCNSEMEEIRRVLRLGVKGALEHSRPTGSERLAR